MVTTRILPLVARTMPITNAGVATVQFSFFPCNYMQLTDRQYQNLKSSPFNPLTDRNPWTKGMRVWGEESNYRGVQETFPYSSSSSSPPPRCGGLARQKQGSVQLMPAFLQVLRIHCFPLCLSLRGVFKKKIKKKKQSKKYLEGTGSINFSPCVRLKRTTTLPPQS